jgi:hypothetical protein
MLIEFLNILISLVFIILIGSFFSIDIDKSHQEQIIMHKAINKTFFTGSCTDGVVCEDGKIFLKEHSRNNLDKNKIYLRKSKALFKSKKDSSNDNKFNDGTEEVDDALLDGLYDKLEEALEANTKE